MESDSEMWTHPLARELAGAGPLRCRPCMIAAAPDPAHPVVRATCALEPIRR